MSTVLLSVKQYIPDVTQYFKPDDKPIPQTASFKVIMFKGKTQYHWIGETALDRIPKRTTVAELRVLLAERALDSCRAFYATLKYPAASAKFESGLVMNSSGVRIVYMHV